MQSIQHVPWTRISHSIELFFFHLRRFTALSFRNPEEISNWQVRSRLAPLRNRRDLPTKRLSNGTIIEISNSSSSQVILPTDGTLVKQNSSSNGSGTAIDMQRIKRETPECVINYNSQRQLYVGCSQSNVIEVKPHCSEDGDEGTVFEHTYVLSIAYIVISHAFSFHISVYNCEGSWTDKNATFIVAKHLGSHHFVCISYQPIDGSNVRLFVGDTCYRSIPMQTSDHHLAANLTVVGKHTHYFKRRIHSIIHVCISKLIQLNSVCSFVSFICFVQVHVRTWVLLIQLLTGISCT